MKITEIITETTAGASSSGGFATVEQELFDQRRAPSAPAKKKKSGKKYVNSMHESAAPVSEADLHEDDLIVIPGQGRARSGFIPHDADRTDHEVEMARSDLQQAAKNASQVLSMIGEISEEQGLEGWVQEKIIKASDYLNTVREYLEGKYGQEEGGYGMTSQCGCEAPCDCAKLAEKGLWDNIHKKRMRIKHGSGERMRKPGSAGAPTAANFKAAQAGSTNEAAAKNNPYAIGMAAAKSSAGYSKKPAHDLPKSVITKGHEIAKSIKKKGR
jgi:hypothetical protein